MRLDSPWMLLAALPAAAALVAAWRAVGGRRQAAASRILRAAETILLALAAAGLASHSGGRPKALVILDRSASLSPAKADAVDTALACGRALEGRFDVSFASFAASARMETRETLGALAPDESGTNPDAALRLARENLADGEPAIIITDGQFGGPVGSRRMAVGGSQLPTSDRLPPTAYSASPCVAKPGFAEQGRLPSFVFLPFGPPGPDAALAELGAPSEVTPGEKFAVVARVTGTSRGPVTVKLRRAGREIGSREIARLPGSVAFEEAAPESGLLDYSATLSTGGDAFAGNNSATALVRVAGKLRAGVIAGSGAGAEALATLKAAGIDAAPLAPDKLGADARVPDVIVMENVSRKALGTESGARLAAFVRSGGGLVVLGGRETFAAGGWEDSGALERALPVSMRPPDQELLVVLVLDRSGSMGRATAGGGETKLSQVKRAALAILDCFREKDRLAVVAFSEKPETIAGPACPSDPAAAAAVRKAIGDLGVGTSTRLADALDAAAELAGKSSGDRKIVRHVVLLSDGTPEGAGVVPRTEYERMLARAGAIAASGATLSTVATGTDALHADFLKRLAEAGRGRSYAPENLSELESVFRGDLNLGETVAEGNFQPKSTGDEIAGALGAPAALAGRNRFSAKPRARTVWEAPPAAGRGREPVLAAWDLERGRAACFGSTVGAPWGAELSGKEFLPALVRWAARRTGKTGCRLSLEPGKGAARRLVLVARDEKGQPLGELEPMAEVSSLDGSWSTRMELLQISPSRYAAELRTPAGVTELRATARGPVAVGADVAQPGGTTSAHEPLGNMELASGAFPIPFPEELLRIGVDRGAIQGRASLAGGRVLSSPAELARMDFPSSLGRGWARLAPWLAAAAVALFLIELALRAFAGKSSR